jgi:hypothetical protein
MNFSEISEQEFQSIDHVRRIISHDNPRKFALIEIDKIHGKYALSWRSDLIRPITLNPSAISITWIGVDQQLVAVSKLRGNIVVALQLDSNLVDIVCSGTTTAVLTETAVFLFNYDGSIQLIEDLPEIGSGLSVANDMFCVDMIDGETLNIEIDMLKPVSV